MTEQSIILVSGMALGPWAFEHVVPHFVAAGLDVHTPTLSGTSPGTKDQCLDVGASTWAEDLLDYMDQEEIGQAIVVAHGASGLALAHLIQIAPERLTQAIFFDGILPRPGDTGWACMPEPLIELWQSQLDADGRGWFTALPMDVLDKVVPEHGATEGQRDWIAGYGWGLPVGVLHEIQPSTPLTEFGVNLAYVVARGAHEWLPLTPEAKGWIWKQTDLSHWAMIVEPEQFAQSILAVMSQRIPTPRTAYSPTPHGHAQ